MQLADLVFVGIKGSVVALDRATGEQTWATHLKGAMFVNVVFDGGQVYATTYGEAFCLNPLTGDILWHNRLPGFGCGLSSIATPSSGGSEPPVIAAEIERHQHAAGSAHVAP